MGCEDGVSVPLSEESHVLLAVGVSIRVILGGHPQLFAPPELELLPFNTLQERKAAFSGRYSYLGDPQ